MSREIYNARGNEVGGEGLGSSVDGIDHAYRVRSVLRCPGGEPEAWVWLVESGCW
jgi:hypothetical protein